MSDRMRIWGPAATLILTIVILLVSAVAQIGGVLFQSGKSDLDLDKIEPTADPAALVESSATYWSLSLSAALCSFLIVMFIKMKRGSNLKDYLAVHRVSLKSVLVWFLIGAATLIFVQVAFSIIPQLFGYTADVGNVSKELESAGNPLLYALTIILIAPIYEELLFRGFLFKGLLATRLGAIGTIIVTALIFSLIHVQYDLLVLANVFSIGILLGSARYYTKSLITPIFLHVLLNGLAILPAFL